MKELSLAGLFREMGNAAARMEAEEQAVLRHGARVVQRRTKAIIGHYQNESGPFVGWAPLADSTIADKERQGYGVPDPLLRTGGMRDSIEVTVGVGEAHIGSNDDVAVYQELGTDRGIPPRSFLGAAAFQTKDHVGHLMGSVIVSALVGDKVYKGRLPISGDE